MRVALLSDIHGNATALRAVLADLEDQSVEAHWILGDVFGYGPLPVTCFRMLDELAPAAWLMGNHDLAALLLWEGKILEDRAVRDLVPGSEERLVALWHASQIKVGLPESRIDRLREAPTWQRMTQGIYAAHGAILVDDPAAAKNVIGRNSYCKAYSTGCDLTLDRAQRFETSPVRMIVVGHTHVPAVGWARLSHQRPGREWSWRTGEDLQHNGDSVSLEEEGTWPVMLCPGSVGQPRDAGGGDLATYAVIDLEEWSVNFRRVKFDLTEIRAAMEPMPRNLYELLVRSQD